jgi:hypothetical protein
MALRTIQGLSSYSLTAVNNNDPFIPATTQVGVTSYKVVKITPEQIYNYITDQFASRDNIYISRATIPVLTSAQLSASSITSFDITISNTANINNISVSSVSSASANISTLCSLDISATNTNSLSISSLSSYLGSVTASNINSSSLSSTLISSTSITATNVSAVSAFLDNIKNTSTFSLSTFSNNVSTEYVTATRIDALSATFNGYLPVAKYTTIIYHTGSTNTAFYTINHPFASLNVVAQLQRITSSYGVSASRLVLADILNNGDGSSTIAIQEPNNSVFQLILMS